VNRSRNQRGFTLMEMLVVVALSAVVMIIAYNLIDDAMKTTLNVESHNQLSQIAQRPINSMLTEIYQARVIFQNDAVGTSFLTRINNTTNIPAAQAILTDFTLPTIDTTATTFAPDAAAAPRVGNCVLILRQLPPLPINYTVGASTISFPADIYRFELYYLNRNSSRRFNPASSSTYDLMLWRSVPFADYQQLLTIKSPAFVQSQWTTIINGLSAQGITVAVDSSGASGATAAFYTIGSTLNTLTLAANQAITRDVLRSVIPEIAGGSIGGKINYSIAYTASATALAARDPVPKYAVLDSSKPNYPGGLEVKVIGAGVSQKVLLRLVVLSSYAANRTDSEEGFAIVSRS
jgi:prepilin-type N-terminal cleavage/methylation domain-containing protein